MGREAIDRRTVQTRIDALKEELQDCKEFEEFGATTDLDYRMNDAHKKAIRTELNALKEILGDL